ncbi:hypothetical protein SBA6_460013 [Candidatus Sulfopaludibacter sp. SbA6]|nr:hypothetical protein SBA6_460013 [Candidatus Sulfopaludibacter sp. SbA6]
MKKFVAAAGASPFLSRLVTVRCPAANDLSRIPEELRGFGATRPRGMSDSLMTRCFRTEYCGTAIPTVSPPVFNRSGFLKALRGDQHHRSATFPGLEKYR